MGKISRWFCGLKKAGAKPPSKEKKRWGFVRCSRKRDLQRVAEEPVVSDTSKHAIAVAAATAALAEAAEAAAQAVATSVELTSSRRSRRLCLGSQVIAEECAAVKIQAAFRGHLARRALRALKGLVKFQALLRGYIARKRTMEALRLMQAMGRFHSSVRRPRSAGTACSENQTLINCCSSQTRPNPISETAEKQERAIRPRSTNNPTSAVLKRSTSKSKRIDLLDPADRVQMARNFSYHWMDEQHCRDPNFNSRGRNSSDGRNHLATLPESPSKGSIVALPSSSPLQRRSSSSLRISVEVDDSVFDIAQNGPQFYSPSSKAFSNTRRRRRWSRCSQSFSDYPNYMVDTQSSRARQIPVSQCTKK
ncbi:hypothetical protein ACLOJK_021429 [Asimina triloba]